MNEVVNIIRQYVAALICDDTLIHHSVDRITPEMIEDVAPTESSILRCIYIAKLMSAPPNPRIILGIAATHRIILSEDKLNKFISENPVDDDRVTRIKAYSQLIYQWYERVSMEKSAKAALDIIMSDAFMENSDRYNRAMKVFMKSSPKNRGMIVMDNIELFDDFQNRLNKLNAARKNGNYLGPTLPYTVSQSQFGYFETGETATLMSNTGGGKTTLVLEWAEFIAWTQNIGVDVVIFSLETVLERLMMRQFCRNTLIPFNMLKNGLVDTSDEKVSKVIKEYREKLVMHKETTGEIRFVFVPDADFNSILDEMEKQYEISSVNGRKPFFMFDYIQKAQFWQFSSMNETSVLKMYTEMIASQNRRLATWALIVAQLNDKTKEAYGAAWVRKAVQLGFELEREIPEGGCAEDKPLMLNKKPVVDFYGAQRYLHRRGDKVSSKAILKTIKSNDARAIDTNILIEASLYKTYEDKNQVKALRQQGIIA